MQFIGRWVWVCGAGNRNKKDDGAESAGDQLGRERMSPFAGQKSHDKEHLDSKYSRLSVSMVEADSIAEESVRNVSRDEW